MRKFFKHPIPLSLMAIVLLLMGLLLVLRFKPPVAPQPARPASPPQALSMLAAPPDWNLLDPFQNSITREDFERLLTTVFTTGDTWQSEIEIDDAEARIQTGNSGDGGVFHLRFAAPGLVAAIAPRHWHSASELPPTTVDRPLAGLRIAIDPGHIGGKWAKLEERWFVVGTTSAVQEGDMTLQVAQLLKPRLEALGAVVSLTREKNEPVTPLRPDSAALHLLAKDSSPQENSPATLQKLAERLFYRTAEIRARAELVNRSLKPDLVLCLHFNAESWGNPRQPVLTDRNHLHLVLNGAYTREEIQMADQRFALLQKLLQRTHDEEVLVGTAVADTFAKMTGLPAFSYSPESPNARPIANHPYLWARNLLANRLYNCPVIFMEPYVMNSTVDHARIQAGDYEGLREVAGKSRQSIFREYADSLVQGLATYYIGSRKLIPSAPLRNN